MDHEQDSVKYGKRLGAVALIGSVMELARLDLKPNKKTRVNDRISAAWYFGSEEFENHAEMIGKDPRHFRRDKVAAYIPPCHLSALELRRLHACHIMDGLEVQEVAKQGNIHYVSLAYQWGQLGLTIRFDTVDSADSEGARLLPDTHVHIPSRRRRPIVPAMATDLQVI